MVLFQSAITGTNYVHNSSIKFNFNTHFWESLRYWDGSRGGGGALAATYQSKIKSSGKCIDPYSCTLKKCAGLHLVIFQWLLTLFWYVWHCHIIQPDFQISTDWFQVKEKLKFLQYGYSEKFLQGSIFTDGQSLPFYGFNFCWCTYSYPLCTAQSSIFHRFNFWG